MRRSRAGQSFPRATRGRAAPPPPLAGARAETPRELQTPAPPPPEHEDRNPHPAAGGRHPARAHTPTEKSLRNRKKGGDGWGGIDFMDSGALANVSAGGRAANF